MCSYVGLDHRRGDWLPRFRCRAGEAPPGSPPPSSGCKPVETTAGVAFHVVVRPDGEMELDVAL